MCLSEYRGSALSSSDTAKLHHFHQIQHRHVLMKVKTITPLLHVRSTYWSTILYRSELLTAPTQLSRMSKISICYLSPRADLPVNYRAFIAPLRPLARLHCKVTYTSTPRGAHLPLTSTPITKTSHQITSANIIKKRTGFHASRTEAGSCLLTNQSI